MSKSGVYRSIDAGMKVFFVILVGVLFMVIGFGGAIYLAENAVKTKTQIPRLAYFSGALGVLGALALPSVFDALFPRVQKVFVMVFPNGISIPMIGGRRSTDTPRPPPPTSGGASGPG